MRKTASNIIKKLSESGMTAKELSMKTGIPAKEIRLITNKASEEVCGAAIRDLKTLGWPIEKLQEAFNLNEKSIERMLRYATGTYC